METLNAVMNPTPEAMALILFAAALMLYWIGRRWYYASDYRKELTRAEEHAARVVASFQRRPTPPFEPESETEMLRR